MSNLYIGEYNYYCAINNWRGSFKNYVIWRNTQAIQQMNNLDW